MIMKKFSFFVKLHLLSPYTLGWHNTKIITEAFFILMVKRIKHTEFSITRGLCGQYVVRFFPGMGRTLKNLQNRPILNEEIYRENLVIFII